MLVDALLASMDAEFGALYARTGRASILDIFSRYVMGWMIAPQESADLAKQAIAPGTLALHADRGSSMRSKPVAALLVDLEVAKSHSRPYVS